MVLCTLEKQIALSHTTHPWMTYADMHTLQMFTLITNNYKVHPIVTPMLHSSENFVP